MKQSVFSPLENNRLDKNKESRDAKKVQIMDSKDVRLKAQRDSMLERKKRDVESPMVNVGSRIEQRLRTSPMGRGSGDLDAAYLTEEQYDMNLQYMKFIQEQKEKNFQDQMMIHQQLIKLGMYEHIPSSQDNKA